jgi:hypothetical protein
MLSTSTSRVIRDCEIVWSSHPRVRVSLSQPSRVGPSLPLPLPRTTNIRYYGRHYVSTFLVVWLEVSGLIQRASQDDDER